MVNHDQQDTINKDADGCGWMRMDLESGTFERQLHIIHNIMIYIYIHYVTLLWLGLLHCQNCWQMLTTSMVGFLFYFAGRRFWSPEPASLDKSPVFGCPYTEKLQQRVEHVRIAGIGSMWICQGFSHLTAWLLKNLSKSEHPATVMLAGVNSVRLQCRVMRYVYLTSRSPQTMWKSFFLFGGSPKKTLETSNTYSNTPCDSEYSEIPENIRVHEDHHG